MSIKTRLRKLELRKEDEPPAGLIVIPGQQLSAEQWEATATDYMERMSRMAAEYQKRVEAMNEH